MYCGKLEEPDTELVSQIPQWIAPESFVLKLVRYDATPISKDDVICVRHEDEIHLKYISNERKNYLIRKHIKL